MLESLIETFSVPSNPIASPIDLENPSCNCGSKSFWKAKGNDCWICEKCSPPISESLVAGRARDESDISYDPIAALREHYRWCKRYEPMQIVHDMPVCQCGSRCVVECIESYAVVAKCCNCGERKPLNLR